MTGASALDSVVLHEVQPRESSNMAESVNFESDHESQHEIDESSEDEEQIDESPLVWQLEYPWLKLTRLGRFWKSMAIELHPTVICRR